MMKHFIPGTLCFCFFHLHVMGQIYPDRHTTNATDGWISCDKSNNPNPTHGTSHWIRYDFGQNYSLHNIIFWNMNHPEYLTSGLKNVIIEYSTNGNNWTMLDTLTIPKAPGSGFYEGVRGPDLNGISARYLLITAMDNHGGGCYGLSEIRVYTQANDAIEFVLDFQPCESDGIYQNLTGGMQMAGGTYSGPGVTDNGDHTFDFDPQAIGAGTYTVDYNHNGGTLSAEITVLPCTHPRCPDCIDCDPNDLVTVNMSPIPSDTYFGYQVTSSGSVSNTGNVEFTAYESIDLALGFEVDQAGVFVADLRHCDHNKLLNPSFENDLDNWLFNNWEGGDASWSTETGDPYHGSKAIKVIASNTVGNFWRIQVRQIDHSITANTEYALSFYAKSNGTGEMRIQVHLDESPWTTYLSHDIVLNDYWTKYEYSFTSDATVSNNVRVTAQYGEQDGTYWIDKVRFFEKN